jgi:DtxR family Mn-dependent transcriptional regulator
MVSVSMEDYLRAMYLLNEQEKNLKSIDISKYLKISKASVSQMIRKLKKQGLIKHSNYGSINLTAKGKRLGSKLTFKHRIIETFLLEVLKMPRSKVHAEANKLEHAFSDEAIRRIKKLLGNPKNDPHGSIIPKI